MIQRSDHDLKDCPACKRRRPRSEFYPDPRASSGLNCYCKDCSRQKARAKYYRHYEKNRAKDRIRQTTPEYKAASNKRKMKYRALNPDRIIAHRILNNAIKRGEMVRQSCSTCGKPNAQAHHHDYSKPLDVEWLCQVCHGKEHRRSSEGLEHLRRSA